MLICNETGPYGWEGHPRRIATSCRPILKPVKNGEMRPICFTSYPQASVAGSPNWIASFSRGPAFSINRWRLLVLVCHSFGFVQTFWIHCANICQMCGMGRSSVIIDHLPTCNSTSTWLDRKDKIVKIVHARASEKLRGDIRGMTRDPDKIKNYERALLDNAPRNFQWCIR